MKAKRFFKNAPVYMLALELTAGAAAYAGQPAVNGAKAKYGQEQVESIDRVVRAFEGIGSERYDLLPYNDLKRASQIVQGQDKKVNDYFNQAKTAGARQNEAASIAIAAAIRDAMNRGSIEEAIDDYIYFQQYAEKIPSAYLSIANALNNSRAVTLADYNVARAAGYRQQESANIAIASAIRELYSVGGVKESLTDQKDNHSKYGEALIASRQTISLAAKAALGK